MPKYFAEIDKNNVVKRVIVADTLEWCVEHLGGEWVETFMDTDGKNYAGIGTEYDKDTENFIHEKPYESWVLNEKQIWTSPIERKEGDVTWDEDNSVWIKTFK